MASPYQDFVNGSVIFLGAGPPSPNSVGNVSMVLESILTVAVYAKIADKRPDKFRPVTAPEGAIAYECIAVSPMVLPPEIKPLQTAIATLSGEEGKLILEESPLNPPYGREGVGALLEEQGGTKFYGWFIRKEF